MQRNRPAAICFSIKRLEVAMRRATSESLSATLSSRGGCVGLAMCQHNYARKRISALCTKAVVRALFSIFTGDTSTFT